MLKEPSAPFLSQLTDRAGMIVSPKAAEAAGKDFGTHPVCAGPFSFTERVAQDRIVLDRFPAYWNAANIHFDRVIYRPIVNSTARLANLQSGAVDIAERILPTDADAVRADPRLNLLIYPWLGYQSINFNLAHGPRANTPAGRDARVRKAFELAIDRTRPGAGGLQRHPDPDRPAGAAGQPLLRPRRDPAGRATSPPPGGCWPRPG